MPIRVLVADDHEIVRAGLRALLEREAGVEVVGEADTGRRAVELAKELSPDLVLLDVSMPDLNGIDATRQITRGGARVLLLSVHADAHTVNAGLSAGASGYLLKNSSVKELPLAIAAAIKGNLYLSPAVTGPVVANRGRGSRDGPRAELSPREREVLQLVAEGKTSKEIAGILEVSTRTVETHRSQLMEKLNIRTTAGLTKYAIREGLTSMEK